MMEGIGPEVDGVFFIGYHAAAGTTEAVLAHTWSGALVAGLWLNGREVGEVGLNAALAGAYGVSVVLVAGDRAVTEEARDLLGAIETVAVKEGVTRTAALCLHPEVAQERIAQAAERALRCEVDPFVLSPPITLRLACRRSGQADRAALMPDSERVGARSVEWTGEDMPTIYKAFQAITAVASG
jgi:D-amino peptidase